MGSKRAGRRKVGPTHARARGTAGSAGSERRARVLRLAELMAAGRWRATYTPRLAAAWRLSQRTVERMAAEAAGVVDFAVAEVLRRARGGPR